MNIRSNLQQVNVGTLDENAIGVHRLSGTVACSSSSGVTDALLVSTSRQESKLNWLRSGPRLDLFQGVSDAIDEYKIIGCFALEVYSCFAFVMTDGAKLKFIYYTLDMQRLNTEEINISGVLCCDIDQYRKEFVMGLAPSEEHPYPMVASFAVRQPSNTRIVSIHRKSIRVRSHMGTSVIQTACMDLISNFLIMTDSGSIAGLDSSLLDVLWEVPNTVFRFHARRIMTDRFGGDFMVYCADDEDGGGSVARAHLEYWRTPTNYATILDGMSERSVIPIQGAFLGATLETTATNFGPKVVVWSDTTTLQLWRPTTTGIELEATMQLAGRFDWAKGLSLSAKEFFQRRSSAVSKDELPSSSSASALSLVKPCITFNFSGLSDVPLSVFAILGRHYATVAVHLPKQRDMPWQTSLSSIQMQGLYSGYYDGDADKVPDALAALVEQQSNEEEFARQKQLMHEKLIEYDEILKRMESEEAQNATEATMLLAVTDGVASVGSDDRSVVSLDDSEAPIPPAPRTAGAVAQAMVQGLGPTSPRLADVGRASAPTSGDIVFDMSQDARDIYDDAYALSDSGGVGRAESFGFWPLGHLSPGSMYEGIVSVAGWPCVIVYQAMVRKEWQNRVLGITRRAIKDVRSVSKVDELIDFRLCSFSVRRQVMFVASVLKEVYLLSLTGDEKATPIELDIRPKAAVTCLSSADCFVAPRLPKLISPDEDPDTLDQYSLAVAGDDSGRVHFLMHRGTNVVQMSSLDVFQCPVRLVATTGDPITPAWNVEVPYDTLRKRFRPMCMPGSAVVAVSAENEVKVFRPWFDNPRDVDCKRNEVFYIYSIKWYLAGYFMCNLTPDPIRGGEQKATPTSMCLDPTGLSMVFGYDSGAMQSFPLPAMARTKVTACL